jgi:hypothetical protein
MRSSTILAPLAVAAVLAVTGCGGSDGPTKAEYTRSADAICAKNNAAAEAAQKKALAALGDSPSQEDVTGLLTSTVFPAIEDRLKQLRALEKPGDDADELTGIYDEFAAELKKAEADPAAVAASSASPFAGSTAKITAYGAKVCGNV